MRHGAGRGNRGHGNALPASQAACRSAVYGVAPSALRAGSRACASTRAMCLRLRCPAPRCRRCVPARRARWHRLRRAAADARPAARRDALHGVQRRGGLHHHELPADRAVVVGLPTDAAQNRVRQEHGAAPPAVELERARRFAEAQVELEARFDVGQRHARQRHVAGLAGECRRRRRRRSRGRTCFGVWAVEADAFTACPPGKLRPAGRAAVRLRSRLA